MPVIEVEMELFCDCGEGLCNQTAASRTPGRNMPAFIVSPCEKCLKKARDEGDDKGYIRGYNERAEEDE